MSTTDTTTDLSHDLAAIASEALRLLTDGGTAYERQALAERKRAALARMEYVFARMDDDVEAARETAAMPHPFVVAIPDAPEVVCPDWCQSSKAEHVADLHDSEGFVIHLGEVYRTDSGSVSLGQVAYVDGTPSDKEPLSVTARLKDAADADEAVAFALAIINAVSEAQGSSGVLADAFDKEVTE